MQGRSIPLFTLVAASSLCFSGSDFQELSASPGEEVDKILTFRTTNVWMEDYTKALQLSQETGKSLLLAFVGVEWCPWSQKMIQEILGKSEFLDELSQEMIFVWVDFPREGSIDVHAKTRVEGLKNRFQVKELPTLVLVDNGGSEIGKFGFLPYSAARMVAEIKNALRDYKQLKEIIGASHSASMSGEEIKTLYGKAEKIGCEKAKKMLLEMGLQKDESAFFLMREYEQKLEEKKLKEPSMQKLRQQILSHDPLNAKGVHFQLAIAEFEALSKRFKKKDNPGKALAPLADYLRGMGAKDLENRWKIEMIMAQFLFSKNYIQEALLHAKNSYEMAPEPCKKEVASSLEYMASKLPAVDGASKQFSRK